MLLALFIHDVRARLANMASLAHTAAFFLIVPIMIVIVIGNDEVMLAKLAAGVIWIAVMLSTTLMLERAFVDDLRSGALDMMLTAACPLHIIVTARILAEIMVLLCMLVVLVPLAALMLSLPFSLIAPLAASLLIGIPALFCLGAMAATLALAANRGVALVLVLIFPLTVPVLVLALGIVQRAELGDTIRSPLLALAALAVAAFTIAPFVVSAALREAAAG